MLDSILLIILFIYIVLFLIFRPLFGILIFPFVYIIATRIFIPSIGSLEKLLIGSLLIITFNLSLIKRKGKTLSKQILFDRKILFLYLLFFLANVLSLYNSNVSLSNGLIRSIIFFSKGATAYLVFRLINSKKDLYFCLYSLIVCLMLLVFGNFILSWQYETIFVLREYGRQIYYSGGVFGNSILSAANAATRFVIMTMPIVYAFSGFHEKKLYRYFIKILCFLSISIALSAIARTGIVVSILIMMIMFLRKKRKFEMIIILLLCIPLLSIEHVKERYLEVIEKGYSVGRRDITAEISLKSFKTHPWLGTGIGSSLYQLEKYGGPVVEGEYIQAEHNTLLVLLVENGIMGLSAFIILTYFCFRYMVHHFRIMGDALLKELLFSLLLSLSGFLLMTLTGASVNDNILWYISGLAFAIIKLEKCSHVSLKDSNKNYSINLS